MQNDAASVGAFLSLILFLGAIAMMVVVLLTCIAVFDIRKSAHTIALHIDWLTKTKSSELQRAQGMREKAAIANPPPVPQAPSDPPPLTRLR